MFKPPPPPFSKSEAKMKKNTQYYTHFFVILSPNNYYMRRKQEKNMSIEVYEIIFVLQEILSLYVFLLVFLFLFYFTPSPALERCVNPPLNRKVFITKPKNLLINIITTIFHPNQKTEYKFFFSNFFSLEIFFVEILYCRAT